MELDLSKFHSLYSVETEKDLKNEFNKNDEQLKLYLRYQENIRLVGSIPSEILNGMLEKKDIYDLFLKAMECLGLLLGENVTYSVVRKRLEDMYLNSQ